MQLLTRWFLIPHAPVSYVDPTSCPYNCSSPRTPVPVPALPPWLQTPPVFKPAVSIDTNQSDYCVSLHLLSCLCILVRFFVSCLHSVSPLRLILCLQTSARLRFPTSSEIIGHTRWSYEWVQHISWSQVLPVTSSAYSVNSTPTPLRTLRLRSSSGVDP